MKTKKVLLMLAFMVIGTATVLANQNWGGGILLIIPQL